MPTHDINITASFVQDGRVLSTGLTFPANGLKIQESGGGSDVLTLRLDEVLSADRALNIQVSDGNRTVNITGDAELSGTNTGDDSPNASSQPLDADLTAIAGLTPIDDDLMQRKSGAWTNRSIAQVCADIYPQADARYLTSRPMAMHMSSAVTWTNMPAAANFLGGLPSASVTKLIPLGGYTQIRFVVATGTVAGAAASKIYIRYQTTYSATAANYLQIGTSEVQCAINSTLTGVDSGWIDLVPGAIGDVYVTILGSGGDGVIDPIIGTSVIYAR